MIEHFRDELAEAFISENGGVGNKENFYGIIYNGLSSVIGHIGLSVEDVDAMYDQSIDFLRSFDNNFFDPSNLTEPCGE